MYFCLNVGVRDFTFILNVSIMAFIQVLVSDSMSRFGSVCLFRMRVLSIARIPGQNPTASPTSGSF